MLLGNFSFIYRKQTIESHTISRLLIGNDECASSSTHVEKLTLQHRIYLNKYFQRIQQWSIIQNRNQPICEHKYHCTIHILTVRDYSCEQSR
jgi:hypothetical protein